MQLWPDVLNNQENNVRLHLPTVWDNTKLDTVKGTKKVIFVQKKNYK